MKLCIVDRLTDRNRVDISRSTSIVTNVNSTFSRTIKVIESNLVKVIDIVETINAVSS